MTLVNSSNLTDNHYIIEINVTITNNPVSENKTSLCKERIPKEAPWKTLALNEQTRKKRDLRI